MNVSRVFLIVLDSLGVGAMPDAEKFGDAFANTLFSISKSKDFNIPNLISLGFGHIPGVDYIEKKKPKAALMRLAERSQGKDTTTGHWEISGIITESPMPTFPDGFPPQLMELVENAIGVKTLCGRVYSGTDVIRDYIDEHLKTGYPIVYTSADSVYQIAAHEELYPPEKLYEMCCAARNVLKGKYGVGRVIARPFLGNRDNFFRTANRRDFSLVPPYESMNTSISDAGKQVISVGKINDIFAGLGITSAYPSHSNNEGMDITIKLAGEQFSGLCFVNLVDFDMKYGHRQDPDGYALALSEFDKRLPELISALSRDDVLMICADHGCDPSDDSTDHTREYIPLLVTGKSISPGIFGTRDCFADIGKTICSLLGIEPNFTAGEDFSKLILKNS